MGLKIRDPKSGKTGDYSGTAEEAKAAGYELVGAPAHVQEDAPDPHGTALDTASDLAVATGSGLTFDLDDEIAGGMSAVGKAFGLTDKGYEQTRDEYRDRKKMGEARSPIATTVGNLAGGAVTTLATGGLGAEGAVASGALKTGLKAAGRIAGEGALQGFGSSEGQGTDLAADTVKGGAAALATGGVLHAGSSLLRKGLEAVTPSLATKLGRVADGQRLRAAGLNPQQVMKEPGGIPNQIKRMKNMGIGRGIAPGTETIGEQADRAITRTDKARGKMADILDANAVKVSGPGLAKRLETRAKGLGGEDATGASVKARQKELLVKAKGVLAGADKRGQAVKHEAGNVVENEIMAQGKTGAARIKSKKLAAKAEPLPTGVTKEDYGKMADAADVEGGRAAFKIRAKNPIQADDIVQGNHAAAQMQARRLREQAARVGEDPSVRTRRKFLREQADYHEARGDLSFNEANARRKHWGDATKFTSESEGMLDRQGVHRDISDSMEAAANHFKPEAGTRLRGLHADEAVAIRASQGAQRAASTASNAGPVSAIYSSMMAGRGNSLAANGLEATSKGITKAQKYIRPVTKAIRLASLPVNTVIGKAVAQSATRVSQARTPQDAAQAHYIESKNNPAYRKAANDVPR